MVRQMHQSSMFIISVDKQQICSSRSIPVPIPVIPVIPLTSRLTFHSNFSLNSSSVAEPMVPHWSPDTQYTAQTASQTTAFACLFFYFKSLLPFHTSVYCCCRALTHRRAIFRTTAVTSPEDHAPHVITDQSQITCCSSVYFWNIVLFEY